MATANTLEVKIRVDDSDLRTKVKQDEQELSKLKNAAQIDFGADNGINSATKSLGDVRIASKNATQSISDLKNSFRGIAASGFAMGSAIRAVGSSLASAFARDLGLNNLMNDIPALERVLYSVNDALLEVNSQITALEEEEGDWADIEPSARLQGLRASREEMLVQQREYNEQLEGAYNRASALAKRLIAIAAVAIVLKKAFEFIKKSTQELIDIFKKVGDIIVNGVKKGLDLVKKSLGDIKIDYNAALKAADEWAKTNNSKLHGSLTTLSSDVASLSAGLVSMASPILNALAPVFDKLTDMVLDLMNAIARLFSMLTGQPYIKAVKGVKEYASAAGGAAKATKDWSMGIDELNVINDKDSSGGGGSSESNGFSYEQEAAALGSWEEVIGKIVGFTDKLPNIGAKVGNWLREQFESITPGFLGESAAKIINNIVEAVNNLLTGLGDVEKIKERIKTELESLLEHINWNEIGAAVHNLTELANGIIDALTEFIDSGEFKKALDDAGFKDIAKTIEKFMKFKVKAVISIVELIFERNVGENGELEEPVFGNKTPGLGTKQGSMIAVDWIEEQLEQVKTKVAEKWEEIKTTTKEKWSQIREDLSFNWEDIKTKASTKFGEIKEKVQTKWSEIKQDTSEKWSTIKTDVGTKWESIRQSADTKFQNISSTIQSVWGTIKEKTSTKWGEIKQDFKSTWDNMKESIKSPINGILGFVETFANGIVRAINRAIESIEEFLTIDIPAVGDFEGFSLSPDFGRVSEVSIPRLASGGFPSMGELFIAREAGPEMVGTIGGKNAVANNNDIVAGIQAGVYDAVMAAMGQRSDSQNFNLYIDGQQVEAAVRRNVQNRGALIATGGVANFAYA